MLTHSANPNKPKGLALQGSEAFGEGRWEWLSVWGKRYLTCETRVREKPISDNSENSRMTLI